MHEVLNARQLKAAKLSLSWLKSAQDATSDGGIPAFYRPITGFSKSYPETTGYVIPTLEIFKEIDLETNWSERITRMTDWLTSLQNKDGSFPGGVWPKANATPSVFNSGQILYGLVSQYKKERSDHLHHSLIRCADWLLSVQDADGGWTKFAYNDRYYVYNARVAWALELAGRALECEKYRNAAAANISNCISNQRSNGWFENSSFDPKLAPVLHTYAYTTQGVLEVGHSQSNDSFIDSARRASEPLVSFAQKHNFLPGRVTSEFSPTKYLCPTGMAQQGIVFQRLFHILGDRQFEEAARVLELSLCDLQCGKSTFISVKGGLAGSVPFWGDYMQFRYPKWAIKFFLDFLYVRSTAGREVVEG